MDKPRKFFIHPGYPKTASTTLQKRLFSRHPGLCYLGKPLTGDLLDIEVAILTLGNREFSQALSGLQSRFRTVMARGADSDRNVLLSHEGFLRPTRYQGHDIRLTAERIRQVFCDPIEDEFDCHVLITIRKQTEIIPSYFFDAVSRSPARFRKYIKESLQQPGDGYLGSLFYDAIVRHYTDLFGQDHVKVLPFEQFINRRTDFMEEPATIFEIDYDRCVELVGGGGFKIKQRSEAGYRITANEAVLDMVNKICPDIEQLPHLLRKLLKRIPLRHRVFSLDAGELAELQQLYAGSNRQLSDDFSLSLDAYGYY